MFLIGEKTILLFAGADIEVGIGFTVVEGREPAAEFGAVDRRGALREIGGDVAP
jgi:hypothetical protein